jgi:hypothetical protein
MYTTSRNIPNRPRCVNEVVHRLSITWPAAAAQVAIQQALAASEKYFLPPGGLDKSGPFQAARNRGAAAKDITRRRGGR